MTVDLAPPYSAENTLMLISCQPIKGIFGKEVQALLALDDFWCLYSQKNNNNKKTPNKTKSRWSIWGSAIRKDTWQERAALSLNGNCAADLLGLKKTAVSPAMAAAANVQFTVTNAAFTI